MISQQRGDESQLKNERKLYLSDKILLLLVDFLPPSPAHSAHKTKKPNILGVSSSSFNFFQLSLQYCDDDPPHAFSQVFLLKANAGTFFVAHDIFRLNIHNSA
ncbi:hypothetical protein M5D96_012100 [Drosophila gunungcola]|uniref:NTF2 domain-containing protein n=1 Tax=Drosophila gunungcola TaxID=103775 RepID=A0A9P9YDZ5_9MUSC|nr:hypothetical protein M5D96_012100 [Drosophila gunungcola]